MPGAVLNVEEREAKSHPLCPQDQSPSALETLWKVTEHLSRSQRRFETSSKSGNIQHMAVLSI